LQTRWLKPVALRMWPVSRRVNRAGNTEDATLIDAVAASGSQGLMAPARCQAPDHWWRHREQPQIKVHQPRVRERAVEPT